MQRIDMGESKKRELIVKLKEKRSSKNYRIRCNKRGNTTDKIKEAR